MGAEFRCKHEDGQVSVCIQHGLMERPPPAMCGLVPLLETRVLPVLIWENKEGSIC